MEEIGATVLAVYMSMVGFIDPATVSANSGTIADRSRLVAARLQKTDGEQIFMMPYNPGRHWILLIVRAKRGTVYFWILCQVIVWSMKRRKTSRERRKAVIWKTLSGTPKQPSSVECGYYVMRFMRDIIMDPSLGFENKYAKGNQQKLHTPKKH
ncbi:hypothetical protein Prudu_017476 [Prunus dulcis]|uniref:Ubiquitin-like protease family profile domain-containing protein n=1 Tax=Prunus dulcis TaxID=3755 RepID=A0A4Y1RQ19_PRUDU|nr:hypothetical protein Prudu_017476 [Prunus dulcis]